MTDNVTEQYEDHMRLNEPAPPSNLTGEERSDAEAIDRIAAYLRRNGYVEVTIWNSGGAVYRREHLHDALAQAERERDEADRRAGCAERKIEQLKESELKREQWLREAKYGTTLAGTLSRERRDPTPDEIAQAKARQREAEIKWSSLLPKETVKPSNTSAESISPWGDPPTHAID